MRECVLVTQAFRFALGLLLALGAAGMASGQSYPAKPVRIVVPYAPGGSADIVARTLAAQLGQSLGQSFIVENRPGPYAIQGTEAVAKAPSDGYTLLLANNAFVASAVAGNFQLAYNIEKDFEPVALVGTSPYAVAVGPASSAKTLQELVQTMRARPGAVNYATAGRWSGNHAAAHLFERASGAQALNIPFRTASESASALGAGQVEFAILEIAAVIPLVRAGKLKVLAVTSQQRFPGLPEAPTTAEAGVRNAEFVQWYGVLAPRGTPPAIIERLNAEINKAVQAAQIRERLAALAIVPAQGGAQVLRDLARGQIAALRVNFCCGIP